MKTASSPLALITGAAQRIGREIALHLAAAGWDIALHFNASAPLAEETANAIRALGQTAYLLQADLSDQSQTATLVPRAQNSAGKPVTALVNNAALFVPDAHPDAAKQTAINLDAPRKLAQSLSLALPADLSGSVVHLLDGSALPSAFSCYKASKDALAACVESDALKLAPRIRVNAIAPGPSLANPRQSQAHFDKLVAETPLGVSTNPHDIATTVAFLLNQSSLTGAIIPLDGGKHLLQPL